MTSARGAGADDVTSATSATSATAGPTAVDALLDDAVRAGGGDAVAWVASACEQPPRATPGAALSLTHVRGAITDTLAGLRVPLGWGLTGSVAQRGRPAMVTDYFSDRAITHAFDAQVAAEQIEQMVAVPVDLAGRRGVLTLGLRRRLVGERLTGRLGDLAAGIARALVEDRTSEDDDRALREVGERLRRLRLGADPQVGEHLLLAEEQVRLARLRAGGEVPAPPPRLTRRERQILVLVAAGGTNAAIARRLGLTPNTVKTYWQAAMRKLEVGNRAEAIHAAHRWGLLDHG